MSNIEEYWNTSSTTSFNFDDEDGVTATIDLIANDVYSLDQNESSDIFAIDSIISPSCLEIILSDVETQNIYSVPPIEETIKKLFFGQIVSLEPYKSFKDKILLLDHAIQSWDCDIILRVIHFLKTTLSSNIFYQQLVKRTTTLHQYSNYLKAQGNLMALENLYMATGFTSNIRDLYFLGLRGNLSKKEELNKLNLFMSSHSQFCSNSNEIKMFDEHKSFLMWQIENKQTADSILEQLAVLCKTNWEKNLNDDKINQFKNQFQISDGQFQWVAMNILCHLGLWKKLISMFVKQNWLVKKQVTVSAINTEHFIMGVYRHNPPKNIMEQLLPTMSDMERALILAEKIQCVRFIINYYINQRDRVNLESLLSKVKEKSEDYFIIKKALESQDKKWKN